ncbi:hypothetical protein [Novosphingobium sp.]|uniref:hypothetical protein n=1 Tax=Novosphingobium sp. TaxID=1874826 RepID=UPI001D248780|nr:hypothetical protein [Novosphingobium sp.]MBX9662256.1 hypothetical protein [Novosphingobium sp.]
MSSVTHRMALVLLLATVQPVRAQDHGFSSTDLDAAARAADPSAPEIARETEALRRALALNPAAALGQRGRGERQLLADALGTGDGPGDLRARWFAGGAILQTIAGGEALLYNPLARGWLALAWRKEAGGWRIVDAEVRAAAPGGWTDSAKPYRQALAQDYAATRRIVPVANGGLAGQATDRWLAGLSAWLRQPGAQDATDAVRQRILAGATARLGSPTLDLLPARVRATFWPTGAIGRADGGATVLFGSALQPHIIVSADFANGARPSLQKLSLINLDHAELGQ